MRRVGSIVRIAAGADLGFWKEDGSWLWTMQCFREQLRYVSSPLYDGLGSTPLRAYDNSVSTI